MLETGFRRTGVLRRIPPCTRAARTPNHVPMNEAVTAPAIRPTIIIGMIFSWTICSIAGVSEATAASVIDEVTSPRPGRWT